MSKNKKIHTTRRTNNIKIIGFIIIAVIIFFAFKSRTNTQLEEISLIINNNDVTQDLSNKLFNVDNMVYMSFNDISKYIDKTIYLENENLIITTSSKKVASLKLDNNTITINGSEKMISGKPIKANENIYLPISELESVYDIDFKYFKESNKAIIDDLSTKKVIATAKKKIAIKKDKKMFSNTLTKVNKNDKVVYLSEDGKWSKVMSKYGYIGYVKTNNLIDIVTEREEFKIQDKNSDEQYLEKDISKEDISSFEKRNLLIQNVFTDAIKRDIKNIKLIYREQNEFIERLKIEAVPIFNECSLNCEFIK